MLWHPIAAYRKRREDARQETRAAVLSEQKKAERERQESQIHADNEQIIRAIERIGNEANAYTNQQRTENDRGETWERRKFGLEVAAVIAAFIGALILLCTLAETKRATIEANRGWIAPYKVQPSVDQQSNIISYSIYFMNVGRGAARSLNWVVKSETISPPPNDDWDKANIQNLTCAGLMPDTERGGVVYAGTPGTEPAPHRDYRSDPPLKMTDDIKNGTRLTLVKGCVAYKTMGVIGRSGFCFVFKPNIGSPGGSALQCPAGDKAE